MTSKTWAAGMAAIVVAASAAAAPAHVVLEQKQATIGKPYKAVFGVTHGCQGSPTIKVTVEIPEGIIAVKPMPKPGWTIELSRAPYAQTYAFLHGKKLDSGVTKVVWTGGTLPDDHYDEFVLKTFVAGELSAGADVPFVVTQDCEKGQMKWHETTSGEHKHHLDWPAPVLTLVPGKTDHKH